MDNIMQIYPHNTGEFNDLAGACLYLGMCKARNIELNGLERVDALTPFYRDRLNNLSPQKRKILMAVHYAGRPLRIRELAIDSRVFQHGIISSQVGRLVKEDLLKRLADGRYTLSDSDSDFIEYLNNRFPRPRF